jgi:hypothetical protein
LIGARRVEGIRLSGEEEEEEEWEWRSGEDALLIGG